jgi:hypothetical protein
VRLSCEGSLVWFERLAGVQIAECPAGGRIPHASSRDTISRDSIRQPTIIIV